jgi:hypothetical protein
MNRRNFLRYLCGGLLLGSAPSVSPAEIPFAHVPGTPVPWSVKHARYAALSKRNERR